PQEGGADADQLVAAVQEPRGEAEVGRHLPGRRGGPEPVAARQGKGPVRGGEADARQGPPDPRVRAHLRHQRRRSRGGEEARRGAHLNVWTVVVAAGSGERFGRPKQYESLRDRRVLDWSLVTASAMTDGVVVVVQPERAGEPEPLADVTVAGGPTRSASVRAGLAALPAGVTHVLVHDAARPVPVRDGWRRPTRCVSSTAARSTAPGSSRCRRRRGSVSTCCSMPTKEPATPATMPR